MRPLVILRPEPGASATAEAARAMGLHPLTMPLFAIEPVEWNAPDLAGFDAVLFTSANAFRHGGPGIETLRALPAHCVGESTAAEARGAGFDVASTGSDGVERLLGSLSPELRLLQLCGVDRHAPDGIRQAITAIEVYRASELPAPEGLDSVEGAVVALHSSRAARRFCELTDASGVERGSLALVAMSEAVAAAAGSGWESVEAAASPSDSALLAIACGLCNKPA